MIKSFGTLEVKAADAVDEDGEAYRYMRVNGRDYGLDVDLYAEEYYSNVPEDIDDEDYDDYWEMLEYRMRADIRAQAAYYGISYARMIVNGILEYDNY